MVDLDRSGTGFQQTTVNLGPSLGWVQMQVQPSIDITAGGTYTLDSGTGLVLVNVAALVTINLPDVAAWVKQNFYRPATAFERAIWIKDKGGNAAAFNITVVPFSLDTIDNQGGPTVMNTNLQTFRLYPLMNLRGWFVG